MFTAPEQFKIANKSAFEALLALTSTAFASAERLAALNLNTARVALEDGVGGVKSLLVAKDPQDLIGLQAALAQPSIDKAVAYSRGLYEISTRAQADISKLFEAQFAEVNRNLASALDDAAKSAPAGSDLAVSAVRSAIAAANSAYDSMNKTVKQVTQISEANVVAASRATARGAAGATAFQGKKVA